VPTTNSSELNQAESAEGNQASLEYEAQQGLKMTYGQFNKRHHFQVQQK